MPSGDQCFNIEKWNDKWYDLEEFGSKFYNPGSQ